MEEKSNKILWTIIAILIIVIIILLCLTKCEKKGNETKEDNKSEAKYLVPTGNVDVFNINVSCQKSETCPIIDINNQGQSSQNNTYPTFNEKTDKDIIGKVFVEDDGGNYIYQQNLNIFTNAAFEYTNMIAPGVSNTYEFKTKNTSNVDIKYYIEMYEESEYKVNLKYRLKKNGSYVIGNDSKWVTADELKTEFSKLNNGSTDSYALDWKWFDDDDELDNNAGENMTSEYKLNIRFYFEELDK